MTGIWVSPGVVAGRIAAPASKSYTHRAVVAGHLAQRRYRIDHPLDAEDTRATADCVRPLGTVVETRRDAWTLRPRTRPGAPSGARLDCGESGTTLRFAAALAARGDGRVTLVGHGRLPDRPMRPLLRALQGLGATVESGSVPPRLPVTLRGPIHGGDIQLDASESSQFASALLFVLPTLAEDSRLTLLGRVVSRPYLDATLAVLAAHQVEVDRRGRRYRIAGGQRYRGSGFTVPGDASSAAYFWVAAALTGGPVEVTGILSRWPQADLAVLDLLERAGGIVRRRPASVTVRAGTLRPFRVDLTDAPDLYPLAGVLAAAIPGRSSIFGAAHVAAKESDRAAGTVRLVRSMGARVRRTRRGLDIEGVRRVRPFVLRGERDHRMVMSAAVAALASSGRCSIDDATAVRKSFPGFWEAIGSLTEGVERR